MTDQVSYVDSMALGGFNYDNCIRNKAMLANVKDKGASGQLRLAKTGTTICGIVFKDGVALCADTRATGGNIVGDKNCEKIHYLAPNIRCCGAGTAADCDHVTEMIRRELELHRLNTKLENRVQMAAGRLTTHAFQYGGHIGTHLIVGGVDVKGPQLIECSSDGVSKHSCFASTGSGSLAAMAILEVGYREEMEQDDAVALVMKAIEAGIYHDLGSGSNVDVAVIKRGHVEYMRNKKHDNFKMFEKPGGYGFNPERLHVYAKYEHASKAAEESKGGDVQMIQTK